MSRICAQVFFNSLDSSYNKKNGQTRMTAETLDAEVSQVIKNTRKLTILHEREKETQHPISRSGQSEDEVYISASGMHISIGTSDILTTLLDLVCLILANRSLCTDRLEAPLLIQTSCHPLLSRFSPVEPAGLKMFLSHIY
jgi:hypothetical protein